MAEPPARSPYDRARLALAVHGAAIAAPISILLFFRASIAARLALQGAIVGEATILAIVAVIAAWAVARTRDALPAGVLLVLSPALSAIGLALMAWTIEVSWFVLGGVFVAIGIAPGLVLHRILLTVAGDQPARFRTMSWYWMGVAGGASWPLALQIFGDVGDDTLLWLSAAVMAASVLVLGPNALVHDDDVETEPTTELLDVPWVRRGTYAAFGVGAVVIGGADAAQALLAGEWQRSSTQTAAVLAGGSAAAAAICAFGPWYHRLHRLTEDRRADAIGIQLLVAGSLVFVGGLSFTYIGLIVSWLIAGAAIGLAAAGLDAAVFPSLAPSIRRAVAARQVVAVGLGGAVGAVFNSTIIGGWSDQWKIALTGIPLAYIGWRIRRFARSARDASVEAADAAATTVPRRVLGLDDDHDRAGAVEGDPVPVLVVDHVDVAYGSVQVLFGVNLSIEPGQIVALLGTNGAGKTTLLRAISGLEPTIGGRIVYAGLDITKTRPTWRVGMGLHQIVGGAAVVPPLTVAENLRLFAHGLSGSRRDDAIDDAYRAFPRLAERRDQSAATLSGGEKQMLALAKALMVQPRLLLIDEFSLGLAPAIIADLLPMVRRIADAGSAVLIVEQSVNIALSIADHAYVMEKGEIGYSGSAAALRDRPELLQAAYLEGLVQALDK